MKYDSSDLYDGMDKLKVIRNLDLKKLKIIF